MAKARDERLEARISRDQKALFQHAAELQGRTLTDFVIASTHDAAVRVIEETQMIRLSAAESAPPADRGTPEAKRIRALGFLVRKDAKAAQFYQRYGFRYLVEGGRRLFVPVAEIAKLFS